MQYSIVRNLNNHVALVKDEEQKDFIVFGRGIAYGKKTGQIISESDVTECYFLGKKDMAYFSDISEQMVSEIIVIAEQIISEAKKAVKGTYNANLLLMISDHLNFAIERAKEDISIKSPLEFEIRRLYPKEIEIGRIAIKLVKKELGVVLPKEEEAMIALHIVNSQVGGEVIQNAMLITEISNKVIDILNFHFQTNLDMSTSMMARFLIHLRYFIMKYMKNEEKEPEAGYEGLFTFLSTKDPEIYAAIQKIDQSIYKNYGWSISENDQIYLMMHVNRLVQEIREEHTDE